MPDSELIGGTLGIVLSLLFVIGWIVWTILLICIPFFIHDIRRDIRAIARKLGALEPPISAKPKYPNAKPVTRRRGQFGLARERYSDVMDDELEPEREPRSATIHGRIRDTRRRKQ